ncbi:hypothetical protein GCM10022415_13040 [Knoellia locipacati]|uniref:Polyketide cyclase n=2 Tax=Knoellia locipacati TaxID=882824 RepID=A0A512SZ77_9MICO|nr:hypothetical protein KLO01_13010 [Knoellia locipacati]
MDTAFTVPAPPRDVWPWVVQLGKKRAGWYLPRRVERLVPPGRRALRRVDQRWQALAVGDVIPDYGGRDETFTVALLAPERHLVHTSTRGSMRMTWSIVLRPTGSDDGAEAATRLLFRVRLAPVRRQWVARTVGGLFDELTIRGLAAGLTERLTESARNRRPGPGERRPDE